MANTKFKILAFDPGLTSTGWSLLEGDTELGTLTVLKLGEFHPGPTADKKNYREAVEQFDKRTISLGLLKEEISKLLLQFNPDAVTSEDIFINMKRPQAYGALCMWVAVARMTCRDVAGKYLVTIPTKICKQVIATRGDSTKLSVQQHIASSKIIKFKDENDVHQMTEHEADSIAVGLALFVRYHDLIVQEVEKRNGK